jgi:hypothetical protein
MKRLSPLTGLGALLTTAPLWMGASDCEVAVVSHEDGCRYDGRNYDVGDSFPDSDGCNTCSCEDDGEVACTLRGCADVCEYNGQVFMIGSSFPDADGCNTCTCSDDGSVACTERACDPGAGCNYDGQHYEAGETFQDADGCNTCSCEMDGQVACTLIDCGCEGPMCPPPGDGCSMGDTQFETGATVLCPDGCNECGCDMDGSWSSTDAACAPLPRIERCERTMQVWPTLAPLYVSGDALAVNVTYSGGCEQHTFKLCWDGSFLESSPVQVGIWAIDTSEVVDTCEALPTEPRVFDLGPLRDAYTEAYDTMTGTIILNFDEGSDRYEL